MSAVETIDVGNGITRLVLRSGRGNPVTPQFVTDINQTLDELIKSPPRALILDADGAKIFSGGFALPIIADWSRNDIREFLGNFIKILHKLLRFPAPTIAVLEGHAIAGGFILSLACDFRIAMPSRAKFGLSEVDLGAAVPAGAQVLLSARTSEQISLKLCCTGELFSAERGEKLGYIDELVDNPASRAVELATTLASKPGQGVAISRQIFGEDISNRMQTADEKHMDAFLDSWFSPEAQQGIQKLASKLRASKK